VQALEPSACANFPDLQASQLVDDVELWNVPGRHFEHNADSEADE